MSPVPAWLAVMVQVPCAVPVAVVPLKVQGPLGASVTARPAALLLAVMALVPPTVMVAGLALMLRVWLA